MTARPTPGRHLILVKHSLPTVIPGLPASAWTLSDEGRRRCTALAARLQGYVPATIAASDEPKATETAQLLAAVLGFTGQLILDHDLREHERSVTDFYADRTQFHAAIQALFAHPRDLIFGLETAQAALTRFAAAVDRLIAATPQDDLVVVTHGTVLSLFVAERAGVAAFPLWCALQLPAFVTLSLPTCGWTETVVAC